ncbi:MAG: Uma2 family endonuclease, partial [Schwartzia sp.]|nr:Uma2 family endonuclease [Schwartzia sp. (in: firmicutes)]
IVEVLSLSTMARDRGIKKNAYERAGVREYWIVDPVSESIEVYHLRDGRFELDHAYVVFPEWEWARMSEEERAEARLSVKVSLYNDLAIDIREVFEDS